MSVTVVQTLPHNIWREFVYKNPLGNIFHTPEMFEVFAKTKGYKPTLWVSLDHNSTPLALLLPVQISVINGPLSYLSTRAVVFGSVLWEPSELGLKGLDLLLQTYTRETREVPVFTELRNLSNLEQIQPLLNQKGFSYEEHLNYLIDINQPPETVFNNIGRRTRKNIRRGLNGGRVKIQNITDREQIASCYALLQKTYKKARVPVADYSLFEAAFDILYPKGMIKFSLAQAEGKNAAASIELLFKDIVYGWYGGMDRAYSSFVPNEILMWHILQWGSENGYRTYDFGGAGEPDKEYGVRDFKAKFGGQLVCYGRNIYIHKPNVFWLSKQGYNIIRRWL